MAVVVQHGCFFPTAELFLVEGRELQAVAGPQVVPSAVLGERCSEAGCLFLERVGEVCFMCVISGCILLEGRILRQHPSTTEKHHQTDVNVLREASSHQASKLIILYPKHQIPTTLQQDRPIHPHLKQTLPRTGQLCVRS